MKTFKTFITESVEPFIFHEREISPRESLLDVHARHALTKLNDPENEQTFENEFIEDHPDTKHVEIESSHNDGPYNRSSYVISGWQHPLNKLSSTHQNVLNHIKKFYQIVILSDINVFILQTGMVGKRVLI